MSRKTMRFVAAALVLAITPGLAAADELIAPAGAHLMKPNGSILAAHAGAPLGKSKVMLESLDGKPLATAQTNAAGVANVAIPPQAAGQPTVVTVTDEAGKVSRQTVATPSGRAPEMIAVDTDGGAIAYDRESAGHVRHAKQPVNVGANGDVGCGAKLKAKAMQTVGGALGGLFGGGSGGGDGGGSFGLPGLGGGDTPGMGAPAGGGNDIQTVADPIADDAKRIFADPATGTRIAVGTRMTPDGLQVSTKILNAPCDGTFQSVSLMDSHGNMAGPTRYDIYEMYLDWKLTVNWTYDRWVNNRHVEHKAGGWSKDGHEILGTFAVPAGRDGIWSQMGFSNAVQGIKGLGAFFPVKPEMFKSEPMTLVVHVTNSDADPVTTVPFVVGLASSIQNASDAVTCPADYVPPGANDLVTVGGGAPQVVRSQAAIDDLKKQIEKVKGRIAASRRNYRDICNERFGWAMVGQLPTIWRVGDDQIHKVVDDEILIDILDLKAELKELEDQLKEIEGDSVIPYLTPIVVPA